jgi:hypothetical protein
MVAALIGGDGMRTSFGFGIVLWTLALGCGGSAPEVVSGPMPDNGNFTGVYFSPQYGEMHLVQNGNAVVGKFKKDERSGKLQGEVEGDLMRFEWTEYKAMVSNRPQETTGHGYFRYMIDASNGDHVLKGRWGLNDENASGGDWNAYKSRTGTPDLESFGDEPTSGGDEGEGEGESSGESSSDGEGKGEGSGAGEEEGDDIF